MKVKLKETWKAHWRSWSYEGRPIMASFPWGIRANCGYKDLIDSGQDYLRANQSLWPWQRQPWNKRCGQKANVIFLVLHWRQRWSYLTQIQPHCWWTISIDPCSWILVRVLLLLSRLTVIMAMPWNKCFALSRLTAVYRRSPQDPNDPHYSSALLCMQSLENVN